MVTICCIKESEKASKQASKQASQPASQPASKPASQQASKPASQQASKPRTHARTPASRQASKQASKQARTHASRQARKHASSANLLSLPSVKICHADPRICTVLARRIRRKAPGLEANNLFHFRCLGQVAGCMRMLNGVRDAM